MKALKSKEKIRFYLKPELAPLSMQKESEKTSKCVQF
ncbi:MAG: hypothetical protein K0S07_422 [Chlamydiales bacterium]|jgi:hypothetical protein|nr:hypothetical protein [Chlamydiales bacterium]